MYLLDTNALIYYLLGDTTLPESVKTVIDENECYYSYVSLWEIAIKQKTGNLKIPYTIQDIDNFCKTVGFINLNLTPTHLEQTKQLPFIHKDPFDRLLIAQAQVGNLTLITSDSIIPNYNLKTLW